MKASKMIWLMLFIATALCYLHPVPQPVTRIKIENDTTDASTIGAAPCSSVSYDPYFIHVNDFRQILIPANKPK
jgi:hypothetical protein